MLGYLRGQVLENGHQSGDGKLILGVGSDALGFVGYSVSVPRTAEYELLPTGKAIELFIHTHVREDALDLYGFVTRLEKELFLTLLCVNGIGPKGALNVLSGCEPGQLVEAIVDGDKAFLTKIPGIGKKTAERVVLELADPLRKKLEAGAFGDMKTSAKKAPAGATVKDLRSGSQSARDAISALIGLGFREGDVTPLISRVLSESETPPRAEDLIKLALRQLS